MVTDTRISHMDRLKSEYEDAMHKLERAEDDLHDAECVISKIRDQINAIEKRIATEALPTHLYYAGCQIVEDKGVVSVVNRDGGEIAHFNYEPSLTDLMELKTN